MLELALRQEFKGGRLRGTTIDWSVGIFAMADEPKKEPLEGLHITAYDSSTGMVTVEMHGSLIRYLQAHPEKLDIFLKQLVDATTHGPSVSSVEVQPRPGTLPKSK
jgi:hypothetical protein